MANKTSEKLLLLKENKAKQYFVLMLHDNLQKIFFYGLEN